MLLPLRGEHATHDIKKPVGPSFSIIKLVLGLQLGRIATRYHWTLHIVCLLNPQGKPAGLQLILNMRDSADVALLTPGDQDSFPSQSHGFRTEVRSISGQVF